MGVFHQGILAQGKMEICIGREENVSKGDDLDLMGWFDGISFVQMFYYGIIEIKRGGT